MSPTASSLEKRPDRRPSGPGAAAPRLADRAATWPVRLRSAKIHAVPRALPRPGVTLPLGLALAFLSGCARVAPLAATPELPLEPWELEAEQARAQPSESQAAAKVDGTAEPAGRPSDDELAKAAPKKRASASKTKAPQPLTATSSLPGGDACLAELRATGVSFSKSAPVLGIPTPVVVQGPIGGISYFTYEKKPMVADCRLVLALDEIGPELRSVGVERVRYSSTYVYRLSHPGRMSMHAYGLAIDAHAFEIGGKTLSVEHDFDRGRGQICTSGMGPLNLIACRIRSRGLFKEQLGPDDNRDHHDHFHFGLRPLPGQLPNDLPAPSTLRARARSKRGRSAR